MFSEKIYGKGNVVFEHGETMTFSARYFTPLKVFNVFNKQKKKELKLRGKNAEYEYLYTEESSGSNIGYSPTNPENNVITAREDYLMTENGAQLFFKGVTKMMFPPLGYCVPPTRFLLLEQSVSSGPYFCSGRRLYTKRRFPSRLSRRRC